jgi:hypothetical protein
MSSDEHIGSLAEAVLEALKGHKEGSSLLQQLQDMKGVWSGLHHLQGGVEVHVPAG